MTGAEAAAVSRFLSDDRVCSSGYLAEELVERLVHRVGQDQRPGQECDSQRD